MRIYKKSRNPYLNLIKSIGNIYKDTNINIDEKLTEYEVTLNILKDDLNRSESLCVKSIRLLNT